MSVIPAAASPRLRPDLVVTEDAGAPGARIVKDPRTRRFFRFGPAEGLILDHLDGRHSLVEIQIALAERLGEALALEEIEEFVDHLAERGLLVREGSRLPAVRPDLGRKVVEALESSEFALRRADAPLPPGVVRDARAEAEARKFDEAVDFLRAGRFQAALRSFEELLAANPANRRARAVRDLLLRAGSEAALAAAEDEPPPRARNWLYLRLPLFDPDRLVSALEPPLRFLWTPAFAGLYAGLLGLAALVTWTHGREILAHIPALSVMHAAGGLIVAAILQTALHEMAHGLTCKHYGGRVPETGFLLILFFLPALYVDVSDAWLFRRRRHRVLVSLAGPMLDLGIAAVSILAWRVMPPSDLRAAVVLLALASAMSVVLNLNPLLRLDGYYVLSDLSGIPNLRQSAARFLVGGLRRRRVEPDGAIDVTPRARGFLLLYALLSIAYMLFVFSILGRLVLGWASRMAGLWGIAATVAIVLYLLRGPLRALAMALAGRAARTTAPGALRAAVAAVLLAVLGMLPWTLKVSGPAQLRSEERAAVRAEIAGTVATLLVSEGDRVRAGQVVARLDPTELETRLAMTRADIRRAQARLALLRQGPEVEQVRQAQEKVAALRVEVEQIRSRYERLTRLREEGLVSADMHEQVGSELRVRQGALRAAQQEARLVEKGARPEEIEAAAAEVSRLRTEEADIERRLKACELRAPADGVVITHDLERRVGERLPAGGTLLEIAGHGGMIAEVMVTESEVGVVRAGLPVRLVFTAYPDRRFAGRVQEIAPAADVDELGRAVFRVLVEVDDPAEALRPGMTGAAKILAGRMPLARLVARRLLRMVDPSLL